MEPILTLDEQRIGEIQAFYPIGVFHYYCTRLHSLGGFVPVVKKGVVAG